MGDYQDVQLRPCPFCGRSGEYISIDGAGLLGHKYTVSCDCGANIGLRTSKEQAVRDWNRRRTSDGAENEEKKSVLIGEVDISGRERDKNGGDRGKDS